MVSPSGTLIQFSCDANQTVDDDLKEDHSGLFTEHLLECIDQKNTDVRNIFRKISDRVYQMSKGRQRPLIMDGLSQDHQYYFNYVVEPIPGKFDRFQ
jgi:hypothetical protein